MRDKLGRRRLLTLTGAAVVTGCLGGDSNGSDDTGGEGGDGDTGTLESLPERGDEEYIQDVEQFESQGREHVPGEVNYERTPPLSGSHSSRATSAGFYEEGRNLENLVHSLEHGAVIVYYDPDALTEDAESDLREWASNYTDPLASVIVVPSPNDEPEAPYTLTAWRHRLRLSEYDPDAVRAFIAEYLGRGPEHPVR